MEPEEIIKRTKDFSNLYDQLRKEFYDALEKLNLSEEEKSREDGLLFLNDEQALSLAESSRNFFFACFPVIDNYNQAMDFIRFFQGVHRDIDFGSDQGFIDVLMQLYIREYKKNKTLELDENHGTNQ